MNKVFIIGSMGACQYAKMYEAAGWKVVRSLEQANLVQFTGGADVSPYLYLDKHHPTTSNDPHRDIVEAGYYQICLLLCKPMVGICRGGQFLNVMNYGKMYQDVDNHAIGGTHLLHDITTQTYHQVTSTHHQMMRPAYDEGVQVVAVASEATRFETGDSKFLYVGAARDDKELDSEVLYYPRGDCLCFQPHPEFPGADSTREYFFSLLKRYWDF
jgi:putative glutamine amidotransferase